MGLVRVILAHLKVFKITTASNISLNHAFAAHSSPRRIELGLNDGRSRQRILQCRLQMVRPHLQVI